MNVSDIWKRYVPKIIHRNSRTTVKKHNWRSLLSSISRFSVLFKLNWRRTLVWMANWIGDASDSSKLSQESTSSTGVATFHSALNIFLAITATLGDALILIALHKVSSLFPPTKLFFRSLHGSHWSLRWPYCTTASCCHYYVWHSKDELEHFVLYDQI